LKNKYLKTSLFFRHLGETGQIQGKNVVAGIFLTELSTGSGDRFTLALGPGSLQQQRESLSQRLGNKRDARQHWHPDRSWRYSGISKNA
jgi:hypothetical protein